MSFSFEIQPGDQDYIPGTWVFLTADGASEGYLTKFDALMGATEYGKVARAQGKDPGARVVQVSALEI